MGQSSSAKLNLNVQGAIDRILERNYLSRQEYLQLTSAMLSGQGLADDDYSNLNTLFDRLQLGRIEIRDE